MLLNKSTLESFGTKSMSLTQKISYNVSRASDYKKSGMLSTLGFEPSDITSETRNHKVFITSKSYKDTLLAIKNKELDTDGLKAQFSCESVDLQFAIVEAVEQCKENAEAKEIGKRTNHTQTINGALSVTSKGNYQLNFYGIYENPKDFKTTLMIKGEVATQEQIDSLVPFWSAKKKKANEPKENNGFAKKVGINKNVTYRNLGLHNIIQ
jgi:hypothetical protein